MSLKVNEIVFGLGVFEMGWHEGLWECIHKEAEVEIVNGIAKSFVCERDEKYWNINKTSNSLETLNQRRQRVVLKHWTKGNKESLLLNLFLFLMWFKSISIIFSNSVPHDKILYSPTWDL